MGPLKDEQKLLAAFPPELRLLTALVGRALGCSAAPLPTLTPTEWARLPELTAAHRVQPLAHAALKASPGLAPPDVRTRVKAEAERGWIQATMFSQELARIARLFADGDVPLLALKGPALGLQAYGSATARTMRDLDILIRPDDLARAREVLAAGGFLWEDPIARLAPERQELYVRDATDLQFRHARLGYGLELHVRPFFVPSLLPLSVAELMADRDTVLLGETPVPTLLPWRHLLYVAAHGAKHGWWRLHWLADFAAFVGRHPQWFSAPDAPGWGGVRALGLERTVGAAFRLSFLCFGLPPPADLPPDGARRLLVAHGIRALARGRQPSTVGEKWAETRHFLRLRPEAAYRRDVLRFRRQVAQDDLVRFPRLARVTALYAALRPLLWLRRQCRPRHSP